VATNSAGQFGVAETAIEVGTGLPVLNTPEAPCSPGGIGTITGKWLANPSLAINGESAPVLFKSDERVDFLCPIAAPGTGLSVAVTTDAGSSQPVTIEMQEVAPRILSLDGLSQGLISFSGSNDLVMDRNFKVPSHPAQPGDQILIRATGIGTASTLLVRFGDVVVSAGSVQPAFDAAGVFEVEVRVPAAMQFGKVPVQLLATSASGDQIDSNSVTAVFESVR
jgi:uncharacterized protein (TIGR03437 family)